MANIVTKTYDLNVTPGGCRTLVNLSQYENGRLIVFRLVGDASISIPSGATAVIEGTKPDGNVYSGSGTVDASARTVSFQEEVQMTAVAGQYMAKVKIMSGSQMVASGIITVLVSADPVPDGAVESDSEIQGLIAEARQTLEGVQNDVNVLEARMDEFASLPPGSTEGNAELVDIRIGYDGTTYPTAGDAVRNQVSNLKTAINENDEYLSLSDIVNIPYSIFGTGSGIRFSNGELITNTTLSYTDYINVSKYASITYKRIKATLATPTYGMAFYDENRSYISGERSINASDAVGYRDSELIVPDNAVYARFSVLNDSATYGQFSLTGESKLYNKIVEFDSDINALDDILSLKDAINIPYSIFGTGSGIRFSNGELITNTTLSYTDYINVSKYASITYKRIKATLATPTYGMAFYDENRSYISGERSINASDAVGYRDSELIVPDNAVYARFSVLNDSATYGQFSLTGESKLYNKTKTNNSPFKKDITFGAFSPDWYIGQGEDYSGFTINTMYSEIVQKWDELAEDSNGYITKQNIGTASDNQTMYCYKLVPARYRNNTGSSVQNNPPIFMIIPSIHGYEKSAAFGTYYFARDLVYNFDKNPVLNSIRTKCVIYVIPVGNPWGFDNKQRKNANGVDLNRNWGPDPSGETDPTSAYYPGAEPFDQPETQAIKGFFDNNTNIFYVIDYHTDGQYKAASWATVNWMTYGYSSVYGGDDYLMLSYMASQFQICDISENLPIEYSFTTNGESIGSITIGAQNAPRPTITYYTRTALNIMGSTFEGNNGLPSEENAYSSMEQKINSELIGNWIKNLFLIYKDAE